MVMALMLLSQITGPINTFLMTNFKFIGKTMYEDIKAMVINNVILVFIVNFKEE